MTKTCSKCNLNKDLEEFHPQANGKHGRRSRCRECFGKEVTANRHRPEIRERRNAQARGRKRTPEQNRKQELARYGLTPESYAALLAAQGGVCAVCHGVGTANQSDRFSIDHDHACCPGRGCCGKCVRGLLCGRCNVMLGMALDLPEVLAAGAAYLENSRVVDR